jgi:hypothetical protein
MATPKETLRKHIEDMHRRPHEAIGRLTVAELQAFHRQQHRDSIVDHGHGGEIVGVMFAHPAGWDTGADVVTAAYEDLGEG